MDNDPPPASFDVQSLFCNAALVDVFADETICNCLPNLNIPEVTSHAILRHIVSLGVGKEADGKIWLTMDGLSRFVDSCGTWAQMRH
jgi:hypothetical protein